MTVMRSTVRWSKDLGEFELRCEDCAAKGNVVSYWPLTTEFWDIHSMRRCRACHIAHDRAVKRRKRQEDQAFHERELAYVRAWRERNPGYAIEYSAAVRRLEPERKRQYNQAYYAKNRDRLLAHNREYKRRLREEAA